jgi:hypothetical protein
MGLALSMTVDAYPPPSPHPDRASLTSHSDGFEASPRPSGRGADGPVGAVAGPPHLGRGWDTVTAHGALPGLSTKGFPVARSRHTPCTPDRRGTYGGDSTDQRSRSFRIRPSPTRGIADTSRGPTRGCSRCADRGQGQPSRRHRDPGPPRDLDQRAHEAIDHTGVLRAAPSRLARAAENAFLIADTEGA